MSGEIQKRLAKINSDLTAEKLASIAYPIFRDGKGSDSSYPGTPKDSGNARRNTKLSGNTILAQYPYAKRLNDGYSKQAPNGMSTPTDEYMSKYIEDYSKKG